MFEQPAHILEESAAIDAADGADISLELASDAEVVPDNWGGLFEQPAHDPEERDLDLDLSAALLTPAAAYCYPYPTQAADLDPLCANYEPDPDLLGLASTLLLSGPAAPVIGDQQLLPWTLQPATMAQQVVAPPPQAQQFVAQHACQMPACRWSTRT